MSLLGDGGTLKNWDQVGALDHLEWSLKGALVPLAFDRERFSDHMFLSWHTPLL